MPGFLIGTAYVILYYAICAASAITARVLVKIPDELFRKLLHFILLGSLIIYGLAFESWHTSVISCIAFAAAVFPILWFLERYKSFSRITTERKSGELKSSLLVVFFMFAAVLSVCWGWLGDKILAFAAVYAWGFGDAAAALVGKRFGKHRINGGKKSVEGTVAMFVTSVVCTAVILAVRGGMPVYGYAVTALAVGAACAAVELYTPGGFDTVTCPFAALAVLLPLTALFG
ncbi:MAG: phosphatidate cytidylyltransferase [Clostridia bacterium]|nr:phosphatidate cytidylyltransferase [Clostridia bacterium]